MDKHAFTDIFISVFILSIFVIPSLFVKTVPAAAFASWTLPVQQLIFAAAAGILVWYIKTGKNEKKEKKSAEKKIRIIIDSGYVLVTFGSLCVTAAFMELILHFAGIRSSIIPVRPVSAVQLLFCILDFAAASFFEEVVYRLYLPEMFLKYLSCIPHFRFAGICSETLPVVLFALAHRYLGIPSVINAALACIFLRVCCKKTGTVVTNTTAHFAYNILSLFLFSAI
jgi:membrane protease YdiL (CAAX protease family)